MVHKFAAQDKNNRIMLGNKLGHDTKNVHVVAVDCITYNFTSSSRSIINYCTCIVCILLMNGRFVLID